MIKEKYTKENVNANYKPIFRKRSILPAYYPAMDIFSPSRTTSSSSKTTQPVSTGFRWPLDSLSGGFHITAPALAFVENSCRRKNDKAAILHTLANWGNFLWNFLFFCYFTQICLIFRLVIFGLQIAGPRRTLTMLFISVRGRCKIRLSLFRFCVNLQDRVWILNIRCFQIYFQAHLELKMQLNHSFRPAWSSEMELNYTFRPSWSSNIFSDPLGARRLRSWKPGSTSKNVFKVREAIV